MIIGLTGTHGAGKGSVTLHLSKKHGFTDVSLSHFLAKEVERRGGIPDRPATTALANELRKESPKRLIELATAPYLHEEGNFIIEPIYTSSEAEFIRDSGGIMVSVDADIRKRYEHTQIRKGPKDTISFEEFAKAQHEQLVSSDPNKQNLIAAIEAADYHILNNGTKEDLEKEIDTLIATLAKG